MKITTTSKVMFWDDERAEGNSIIVGLKYGYRFSGSPAFAPEHVQGFDTVREAKQGVKWALRCDCDECNAKRAAE
jgi:hypothetical protein